MAARNPEPRIDTCPQDLLQQALPWCRQPSLAALGEVFSPRTARKGESLLAEGEKFAEAYLIVSGCVRLYFTRRDGREFNTNFFARGSLVLPLTQIMWNEPSLFGAAAVESTAMFQAGAADMRRVLADHGEWEMVQRKLLARLVTRKIEREHELLALDGRQRYMRFEERHPDIAARIPLSQLATYLGITDVSLSRIRRTLRKR